MDLECARELLGAIPAERDASAFDPRNGRLWHARSRRELGLRHRLKLACDPHGLRQRERRVPPLGPEANHLFFVAVLTSGSRAPTRATWLFHRQVKREEAYLVQRYGAEYADYCGRVRRYL